MHCCPCFVRIVSAILHVTDIQTKGTNRQRSILAPLKISPWGTVMDLFWSFSQKAGHRANARLPESGLVIAEKSGERGLARGCFYGWFLKQWGVAAAATALLVTQKAVVTLLWLFWLKHKHLERWGRVREQAGESRYGRNMCVCVCVCVCVWEGRREGSLTLDRLPKAAQYRPSLTALWPLSPSSLLLEGIKNWACFVLFWNLSEALVMTRSLTAISYSCYSQHSTHKLYWYFINYFSPSIPVYSLVSGGTAELKSSSSPVHFTYIPLKGIRPSMEILSVVLMRSNS